MKTLTVIGARPQFIKAAPVGRELTDRGHRDVLVHTGQHYDYRLSKVFFDELGIPEPDYNLNIGSTTPASQIGAMMSALEPVLEKEKPDCVLVYGDTNSTLAAALTALKCQIPIVHIEGGERNFTKEYKTVAPASIPEEANRILVDHISTIIFCASKRAVENLSREGLSSRVFWVGDISLDTYLLVNSIQSNRSDILKNLKLSPGEYILATVHRAINTDYPDRLREILIGLSTQAFRVILPIHPRTGKVIMENDMLKELASKNRLEIIDPVGYFDMLALEKNARIIVTDSGGVIREAFFSQVPSIIVDETTEWIDLVQSGWSNLVGADSKLIIDSILSLKKPSLHESILGDGTTRKQIVDILEHWSAK
ncbi:MAG: non-hydrolyzing UDP-N-acetylglucosamine 2-epimerase [Anaerolineaceae bacterium]